MKINKSELFKTAWKIAKAAAAKFNKSAREFLSEALKQAWKNLKQGALTVKTIESIKHEILKLKAAKKIADKTEKKEITDQIKCLRTKFENLTIAGIKKDRFSADQTLTERQADFYESIIAYLNNFVIDKGAKYKELDRRDRLQPSGTEIKIAIKRIGELKNIVWNKINFTELVTDYNLLKDTLCGFASKYDHLRKDNFAV